MAQCAQWVTTEVGVLLAQSSAEVCTAAVVLTPAEYVAISTNPFNLSFEDGALVSGAVVAVWGAAWVFKALILTLKDDGAAPND